MTVAVQPVRPSYQTPPLLTEYIAAAPKAPANRDPLYGFLRDTQDHALDGEQGFRSAVTWWTKSRTADSKHDRCLTKSRECHARGEYAMADYWVEQAQHWDAHEDTCLDRVWATFTGIAESCRQIVNKIERLLSPSRQRAGKGQVTR
jgi:hypothetical protein